MSRSIWHELSPTHHDQLRQIREGTAPPEVVERFRRKYLEAVAIQARRTGERFAVGTDDRDDAIQSVVLEYLASLDGGNGPRTGEIGAGAYRQYLCGLIRNQICNFVRDRATTPGRLAALKTLLADEANGGADAPAGRGGVELGCDEYRAVLRESLDEWLVANRDGKPRLVYDALMVLLAEPNAGPAGVQNAALAERTGLSVDAVKQNRFRIRKALQTIIARNVLRRLES